MRARPQFLIFLLLLLVVTSQNAQARPAQKHHAATHFNRGHSDVPLHKKRSRASVHNRHSTAPAHRKHTAAAAHKRHSAAARERMRTYNSPTPRVEVMTDSLRHTLINSENNRITNPGQLTRLKEKLQQAVSSRKKVVRFVHIGDSHIQADMMTRVLRLGLQYRYGNAGRGIVFPWQMAKTNGPSDIYSFSNNTWLSGRLAVENNPVTCGVCGYGLKSDTSAWTLEIGSKQERGEEDAFDLVRLFTGKNTGCFNIRYNGTEESEVCMEPKNNFDIEEVSLRMKTNTISLSGKSPDSTAFAFYGVSFEKKKASGVIYHSIGVNGAEFSSFNNDPLFFDQIGALNADCYIISLGTNEAQKQNLNVEDFTLQVRNMLRNLRQISPNAVFIITTPPPSFLHGVAINPKIRTVTEVLTKVSEEEQISLWNFYDIIGAKDGLAMFQTYGFYRPDVLHFNRAGYELQGFMLLSALLKSTL